MADRAVSRLANVNNALDCLTTQHLTIDNIEQFGDMSNRVFEAAKWFATYRKTDDTPIVILIRQRFDLSTIDAIAVIREGNVLKNEIYASEARNK